MGFFTKLKTNSLANRLEAILQEAETLRNDATITAGNLETTINELASQAAEARAIASMAAAIKK